MPSVAEVYSILSEESTEGTNSLLMKSPVGTDMCLLRAGIVTVAKCAMLGRGRLGGKVGTWGFKKC